MKIKELSLNVFYDFVKKNPLASHYQTMNYAMLMSEQGYEHEFIGLINDYGRVCGASLILIKKINRTTKYGYAPKGFILDYFDRSLLEVFTKALINYYKKRKVCFIKLNPELAINQIDYNNNQTISTSNQLIKKYLNENGYIKLKDNLYFESIFPRFNGIVDLKNYSINNLDKNCRNKVRRSMAKGLELELASRSGMDILQKFIYKKRDCNAFYYKDYYNAFHQDDMIDLFLVSINAEKYLTNARKLYEEELERNSYYNEQLTKKSNQKNINKKMMSDKKLATEINKKGEKIYIAGALVIRFLNRVQILISGYDKKYRLFDPNYFLHYKIIEYYKKDYSYLDLNGLTGDFTKDNPYHGLNQFKLGFNPKVYEFIGEYDLPIKNRKYQKLKNNGTLAKTFNKTNLKKKTSSN